MTVTAAPTVEPARPGRRPVAAWLAAAAGVLVVAGTAGAFLWKDIQRGTGRDAIRDGTQSVNSTDAGTSPVTTLPVEKPPAVAPRVTAVEIAGSGPFKSGATVPFVVTFSRPVTVTGSPVIEFGVGDDPAVPRAVFRTGDGTATLSFTFTVPDDVEGTGIALVAPAAIGLAGGGIVDAATGKPADLALDPPSSLVSVRIDGVAPRVAKVTPPAGRSERKTGDRLVFHVEFDEAVAVEGKPVLSFRAGVPSRQAEFTDGDDRTLVFASTVAADDERDEGVTATGLMTAGGAIRDAAGNAADVAFSPRKSAAFTINARPTPPVTPPKPEPPPPSGPRPGTVETNSIGMKLVVIPAGDFQMGSGETKQSLRADGFTFVNHETYDYSMEGPMHRVRIMNSLLMGVHEVTLGEFLSFYPDGYSGRLDCETAADKGGGGYMGKKGEAFPQRAHFVPWNWGHPSQPNSHPVVNVSWNDAVAFCRWLSRKEGKTYRSSAFKIRVSPARGGKSLVAEGRSGPRLLERSPTPRLPLQDCHVVARRIQDALEPTEAEWEYACRAGTTTRFWNGDDADGVTTVDNVADVTAKEKVPWLEAASRRDGHVFTAPVGSFGANPFGLHDMHGNIVEWCSDWHGAEYYAQSPAADPQGLDVGSFRVIRGGSWSDGPVDCRSADRGSDTPTSRNGYVGFRVVHELE